MADGWVDYEHEQDIEYRIGEPTQNTYVDPEKGLFIEAMLYGSNPYVKKVMTLYRQMREAGSTKQIGFSIEGQIGERDELDPSIIKTIMITGVAVTLQPANPNATWDEVQKSLIKKSREKSMTTGYGVSPDTQTDGGALRPQHFAHTIRDLSRELDSMEKSDISKFYKDVLNCLEGENNTDEENIIVLQLATGQSASKIRDLLNSSKQ